MSASASDPHLDLLKILVRPLLAAAATIGLYGAWTFVYAFCLSPVRHIPGPWLARVSQLPLKLAVLKARRAAYAHELIQQYGPIVVIAPDQIHTTDDEAMKVIYDRKAIKTPFYEGMGSWKGVKATLAIVDYPTASPTRNNLIQCFQNRNLDILVGTTSEHVFNFVHVIEEKTMKGEMIDGVVWFRLLALDVVCDVLWGEQTNLVATADGSTPDFLRRFHAFSKYNATKSFIPGFDFFVKYFGTQNWKTLRNDCNDMDITVRQALQRWDEDKHKKHARDVLSMLKAMESHSDPAKRLPNDHIPAYMVEMMAAGSSTTSHTAAFVCRCLSQHPEYQKQLRQELFDVFPNPDEIELRKAVALPYLDSVIRETMRMWPMIPGPAERYLPNPVTIAGKTIPPGIIASTSPYDQGRLEEVYRNANSWCPNRWLEDVSTHSALERMKLNWTPFGYGSRVCPGQNLALTELKYIVAALLRRLRCVPCPGYEDEQLELRDVFAAGTATGHCWLKFERSPDQV